MPWVDRNAQLCMSEANVYKSVPARLKKQGMRVSQQGQHKQPAWNPTPLLKYNNFICDESLRFLKPVT